MGMLDKAKDLLNKNQDKIEQAIDKAGDAVDAKTGGKYAEQVDKAQEFARDKLGSDEPGPDAPPPSQ